LTLCLLWTAQSCYSQSLDSLPIKELNNEFLKGISARERLHYLKNVVKLDSLQLSLYNDSLIPAYHRAFNESKKEIVKLNTTIQEKNYLIQVYRYSVIVLSVLCVGLIF
jgi:hypothetical protein